MLRIPLAAATAARGAARRAASTASAAPVRGMRDVLPAEAALRALLLGHFTRVTALHGYAPIEPPLVEHAALFARSLGAGSDVVAKEMYTLAAPRAGGAAPGLEPGADEAAAPPPPALTLRPEGTAGVLRALISSGLVRALPQRVAYAGPMFRHERPQRGRHRQFTQLGVEAVGCDHPLTDVEVLGMAHQLLAAVLGSAVGAGRVRLLVNSLGDEATLAAYSAALRGYFSCYTHVLSPDSVARLARGAPLRILDSKAPADAAVVAAAPRIASFLTPAAAARFDAVQRGLAWAGVPFVVAPTLVRGLDYYRHTIFEFVVGGEGEAGGAAGTPPGGSAGQLGTVLAGGRYDGLSGALGGPAGVPAIGWAAGLERLALLTTLQPPSAAPQVVVCPLTSAPSTWAAAAAVNDGAQQVAPPAAEGAPAPPPAAGVVAGALPTRAADAAHADASVQRISMAVAAAFRACGRSALVLHAGSDRGAKKQLTVRGRVGVCVGGEGVSGCGASA